MSLALAGRALAVICVYRNLWAAAWCQRRTSPSCRAAAALPSLPSSLSAVAAAVIAGCTTPLTHSLRRCGVIRRHLLSYRTSVSARGWNVLSQFLPS